MSRARRPGGGKAEGTIGAKSVHATARESVTLRVGRDIIPPSAVECTLGSAPVGSATGHAFKVQRDHSAIVTATRNGSAPATGVEHRETTGKGKRKRATGRWLETFLPVVDDVHDGRVHRTVLRSATRVIRTCEDGDGSLSRPAARPMPRLAREQRETVRVARVDRDADVRAYLRTFGYDGPITAHIRARALDAMAHADTVRAYMADAH